MAERDPYDFSALAQDFDLDDEIPGLSAHQFVLSEEALDADTEFQADFEAMAGEAFALPPPSPELDAEFRKFQAAISHLQDQLIDLELEAEEAWLASLMAEETDSSPAAFPPLEDILPPGFGDDF